MVGTKNKRNDTSNLCNFLVGFANNVVPYESNGISDYCTLQWFGGDDYERVVVLSQSCPQTVHKFGSERALSQDTSVASLVHPDNLP